MCPTPDSPPRHVTFLNQVIPDQETKSHPTPQQTQMKIGDKDQAQLQVDTGGEQSWVCEGSHPVAGEFTLSRDHPPTPSDDCKSQMVAIYPSSPMALTMFSLWRFGLV